MSTQERIIEEAKEYALRNTPSIVETYSVNSYMAGALSERNKVIEEVKLLLEQSRDKAISERAGTTPAGDAFLILKGHEYEAVKMIKLLESLKV